MAMNYFTPRPSQEKILRYSGGRLGIAAVPGAGKTHILSALAAQIIQSGGLLDGQEVLIVTLVNSAVDNFETRIQQFFEKPLLALYKYRVRTLHGLAHDIVREKPGRVGLSEQFGIVAEGETDQIRRESVNAFLAANPNFLDEYLDPALDENKREWVRRDPLPKMLESLATAFIRSAKDRRMGPEQLRSLLERQPGRLPLAEAGLAIYSDYQRALAYRGAVDFDDLIRLSLDLLESDSEYLERLRYRYPYILEDEAQDSSVSQEQILRLLSGGEPGSPAAYTGSGWVRVGDPNQAIFETFTTASPELLRAFIRENPHEDMPESGRSQAAIIELANRLIEWTANEHPVPEVRSALAPPRIQPVPEGDPQPNPPYDPSGVRFVRKKQTPDEEIEAVAKSIEKWLPEHRDWTAAVLVPRNQRGIEVINALKKRGIETVELISSTSSTRATAGSLNHLLAFLADPQSARKLSLAYQVWRREVFGSNRQEMPANPSGEAEASEDKFDYAHVAELLRRLGTVEDFTAPRPGRDWLAGLAETEPEAVVQELADFQVDARRWLAAVSLPIDQLVLTLAPDVFSEAADLALAHKLALVLRSTADHNHEWRLPELTAELAVIAKNERRFIGFSADDAGFDPERHKGKVVVTTMHKAKGLEWERVYLMSVNNYDFPSLDGDDQYIAEKWFARSHLNLEAEALAQLRALEATDEYDWYAEGAATQQARVDYVRERLRLLYVAITRAKKELIVTWNTGRQGELKPARAIRALME